MFSRSCQLQLSNCLCVYEPVSALAWLHQQRQQQQQQQQQQQEEGLDMMSYKSCGKHVDWPSMGIPDFAAAGAKS